MGVSHAVEEAGSTPRSIAFQLAQEVFARHDADLADAGSGVVLGMWDPAGLLYGLGLMAVAAVTLVRRAPFRRDARNVVVAKVCRAVRTIAVAA